MSVYRPVQTTALAMIVLVVATVAGGAVLDAQVDGIRDVAEDAAADACNAELPGGGWQVVDDSVDPGADRQSVVCVRNDTVREIAVSLEVYLSA